MPRKKRKPLPVEAPTLRGRLKAAARKVLLLGVAGVLGYGVWDLYRFCAEGDLFVIREVRIEGNHLLLDQEILDALQIPARVRLWQVKPEQIESQLLSMSSIRSVHVERVLPETLVIDLMERSPIADWRDPKTGKRYALDEETVLLAESDEMNRRLREAGQVNLHRPEVLGLEVWGRLPGDRIESENLEKLLSALGVAAAREEDWVPTVRSVVFQDREHGWVLRCGSEEREVRIGDRHFLERIGRIDPVWKVLLREGLQVAYIDLRFPEQGVLLKPLNCDPTCWMEIAERYPEPRRGNRDPV
jgi:cell division protein FtsQ